MADQLSLDLPGGSDERRKVLKTSLLAFRRELIERRLKVAEELKSVGAATKRAGLLHRELESSV